MNPIEKAFVYNDEYPLLSFRKNIKLVKGFITYQSI